MRSKMSQDPQSFNNATGRGTKRLFFLLLLSLACLSNVVVQGQGSSTTTNSAATSTVPGTQTGTASGTPTGTATRTSTATGTANGTATATGPISTPLPTRTPSDPVSSLTLLNPKANNQNPPIFKIGTDIVFAWDYDKYLLLPPTNITIECFQSTSPNTIITIGAALPGNTKNYTWAGANQINVTNPLQTAFYTLRIFDGAIGRNGVAQPLGGYLATYTGLKFGLYATQPYIPGDQSNPPVCATCQFSAVTNDAMALATLPNMILFLGTILSVSLTMI